MYSFRGYENLFTEHAAPIAEFMDLLKSNMSGPSALTELKLKWLAGLTQDPDKKKTHVIDFYNTEWRSKYKSGVVIPEHFPKEVVSTLRTLVKNTLLRMSKQHRRLDLYPTSILDYYTNIHVSQVHEYIFNGRVINWNTDTDDFKQMLKEGYDFNYFFLIKSDNALLDNITPENLEYFIKTPYVGKVGLNNIKLMSYLFKVLLPEYDNVLMDKLIRNGGAFNPQKSFYSYIYRFMYMSSFVQMQISFDDHYYRHLKNLAKKMQDRTWVIQHVLSAYTRRFTKIRSKLIRAYNKIPGLNWSKKVEQACAAINSDEDLKTSVTMLVSELKSALREPIDNANTNNSTNISIHRRNCAYLAQKYQEAKSVDLKSCFNFDDAETYTYDDLQGYMNNDTKHLIYMLPGEIGSKQHHCFDIRYLMKDIVMQQKININPVNPLTRARISEEELAKISARFALLDFFGEASIPE